MDKHNDSGFYLQGIKDTYPDIYKQFEPYLNTYFPKRDYVSLQELQATLPKEVLQSFLDAIGPAIMQKFREINKQEMVH